GQRSERTVRLLDQMELALEELESSATEDEIAAERAVAKTTNVVAFTRKHSARQPFPEHLPRERVVEPGPTVCRCCGSPRLRKLGEDITETLEVVPRQWKVVQHIREKFSCRDCATIVRSAGRIRRRRCSTTRAIGPASMPRRIWPAMPGSSRPTPSADTTGCTKPTASRARSSRRRAGSMPGDPSSRWPISLPPPGAGRKAKHWR